MLTNHLSNFPRALELATHIKLMIFDVDGVLTDGRVHYSESGELFKSFSTLDGYGLKLLARVGVRSAIITGRQSNIVQKRAAELGIQYVYQNASDKSRVFAQLLNDVDMEAKDCGYMGDDWPDLEVMQQVKFAAAPAQAHKEVCNRSHYVTQAYGGRGAVREVCDLILQAQGHYAALLS